VFVLLIAGVVLFVVALGALVVDQVGALVDAIPGYAQQITDFLDDTLATELSGADLASNLRGNQGVQDFVNGLAAAAVGRTVCSVLPPGRQQVTLRVWDLAIESTGGYVYSRALLAGCSAVATTLFLTLVGVPYPLALGLGQRRSEQDAYNQQAAEAYAATQAPPPPPPAPAAPPPDTIAELERLARLHESGALTDQEFAAAKARALGL
jgi:predicted PurR-regulated permease PerM